jgi:hypothetical protein
MSTIRIAAGVASTLAVVAAGSATAAQEDIQLVTVVGCLQQDSGDFPYVLRRATEGTATRAPYASRQEVNRSNILDLGSLEYRLVGVDVFGIDPHVGHRVQVKGLKMMAEGELRLNVTSVQRSVPHVRASRGRTGRRMPDECESLTP